MYDYEIRDAMRRGEVPDLAVTLTFSGSAPQLRFEHAHPGWCRAPRQVPRRIGDVDYRFWQMTKQLMVPDHQASFCGIALELADPFNIAIPTAGALPRVYVLGYEAAAPSCQNQGWGVLRVEADTVAIQMGEARSIHEPYDIHGVTVEARGGG